MKFAKPFGLAAMALLAACASGSASLSASPKAVAVRMSPVLSPAGKIEALRIEIRFRGDEDGVTEGRFQAGFDTVENLLPNYTQISVSGGVMKQGARPGAWSIETPPSAPITLSYVLRSGIDGAPTSSDAQPHAPWIMDDWIFLYGQSVFPRLNRPRSTPATFAWDDPSRMTFASNLEALSRPGGGTLDDLVDGKIIAGKGVRVLRSGGVRLAVKGSFVHSDQRLLKAAADIIHAERQFWGDPLDTPYLVALGEIAPEPGTTESVGGMGGAKSFGIAMLPDTAWTSFVHVLAHEAFHTWNWFQMGPADKIEIWFNEGVTDFYARTLPLRAGLLTIDEYAAGWNAALLDYARTLETPEPGYEPYLRGGLMAVRWDRQVRDASNGARSLDDAMREIRRRAAAGAEIGPGQQLAAITAEWGLDIRAGMAAHLERGDPIVLEPGAFGPCFRVETMAMPRFDRGFDFAASARAGMVVTGVRAGGPAHAAGLRDGMRIVQRVETHYPDATLDEVWIVETSGGARQTLRWKPAGTGSLSTQRLVRIPGSPADPKSCGLG